MIEFDEDGQEADEDTTPEVAELKRVFRRIHAVLESMLAVAPGIDSSTPAAVVAKLSELQTAHRRIVAAEEAFYAQNPPIVSDAELDLSALRAEIGSQLDRLRAAILADKLPFEIDPCAACRAAISV